MCLKATPSRKAPQTPTPATSKRGRNGEEPAPLLRVGTGQKALRAVGGSFFKLWDSKRDKNILILCIKTFSLAYKFIFFFLLILN